MVAAPAELDDRSLVEAAQADPARFLALYDRYFHRVYAYVLRRAGSRAEAEDVTSEVFQRALANLKKYEWRGVAFIAWLFRIAANELADRRKQAARESGDLPADVVAANPDVERRAMVFQLVERLPEDQRRVIELRFGEGRSIADVARAMGKSDGAVKQLQRRALESLRARMESSHG
ncbi:MAG: sigma-70 family RNA polymerase sigma factor [Acidobacteria bacterium]|nr:sigma-70 family RNA polymerase sigma factor [Acidobacteriota bacterium]